MSGVSGSGKTDDYSLGMYGGKQWAGTSLRLGANYTWHKLDTNRNVAFSGFSDRLSAQYDGQTAQLFAEVGHRFDTARNTVIEPFASLAYVNLNTDGFKELGGEAAMTGSDTSMNTVFSTLGSRFSIPLSEQVSVRSLVGWRHALGGVMPESTNTLQGSAPFTVHGVPLARDTAVIEAGVEAVLGHNMRLAASYSGQFASKLNDNGAKLTLEYRF